MQAMHQGVIHHWHTKELYNYLLQCICNYKLNTDVDSRRISILKNLTVSGDGDSGDVVGPSLATSIGINISYINETQIKKSVDTNSEKRDMYICYRLMQNTSSTISKLCRYSSSVVNLDII